MINGLLAGQPTANVLHWSRTSSPGASYTQAEADSVAAGIRAAWVSNFNPRQSAVDWLLGTVTAQDLTTNLGPIGSAAGSTAGSRSGASLPANCACCVSWTTAMHYRGGHGRTYLAGVVQADQANATSWSTASVTAFQNAAIAFQAALSATFGTVSGHFVILRRTEADQTLIPPVVVTVIGATVDTRIDSQRRRLGKDR